MPERPDGDTLRLLLEVLEEIGTNEAIRPGETLFQTKVGWEEGDVMRATFVEPPLRVLRHLLDLLRHLDMPKSDVRLERVFPIIERLALPDDWLAELEVAKQDYRLAQEIQNIRVQQPDEPPVADPETQATWITPREAFGIWAYGGVIHHDYAKEQKWVRLGIGQAWVRQMAHDYAMMLLSEADFLLRLLKSNGI